MYLCDPTLPLRPDVLELDMLLTELSLCSSRSELYFRFIRRKLDVVSVCVCVRLLGA